MRLLLVLVIAAACASTPVRRFTDFDHDGVTEVLDRQAASWNNGDLAGYMDGYAKIDGLVFTSGGHVRLGWQDAFDHYKARYATDPKAMGHLAFTVTRVDPVGPDGAVVLGQWKLTGSEHPGEGVFTLVFQRRPEGWRIIHDHTSVLTP
jgi:beta-aspartyl-peptidase (threonine type)